MCPRKYIGSWLHVSYVTNHHLLAKNSWQSVQKQRREGKKEKNKDGNRKAFCVTTYRNKLYKLNLILQKAAIIAQIYFRNFHLWVIGN